MKILVIGMCGNSLFYQKETGILLKEEPGGKGYNQAVAIAKLGGRVSFIGAIGKDESGNSCKEYLDKIGVNNLLIEKEETTTYATINVDQDGNNFIDVFNGAKMSFDDLDYIKDEIIKHDIILLQNEIDVLLNKNIIEFAFSNNKYIIVNPAPVATWVYDYLDKIDLVTPNEEEARYLFNLENIDVYCFGTYLFGKYKNKILVTLGDKGCLFVNKENYQYFDSLKVNAVDTTGAGDMMNAALAYCISKNISIDKAIILGTHACSYSVQRNFVLDSYPQMEELTKYFQKIKKH